jgi:hypothetical protein
MSYEEKPRALFGLVVRDCLFIFHWGEPLNEKWIPDVAVIKPEGGNTVFTVIIGQMGRPTREVVEGNLGNGTFIYRGIRGIA